MADVSRSECGSVEAAYYLTPGDERRRRREERGVANVTAALQIGSGSGRAKYYRGFQTVKGR